MLRAFKMSVRSVPLSFDPFYKKITKRSDFNYDTIILTVI